MKYEIDENNIVRIFDENETLLFWQPNWPDKTPFANQTEASNWAEVLINAMQDPFSEFVPGNSPNNHPAKRGPDLEPENKQTQPTDTNA